MELLQGFPFCVCRVNLIGGRRAKGTPTDTAAVFTPAKAADRQLYMYNLTLPHGFFSRSPPGAADLFKSKLLHSSLPTLHGLGAAVGQDPLGSFPPTLV